MPIKLILYFQNNSLPDIIPYDENALMMQIAEGSEKAFGELYRIYVPLLAPFIFKITKLDVMVDEVIQETFLRLWISRDKLSEIKNPRGWIFRITSNICYTYLQRLILERNIVRDIEVADTTEAIGEEQLDARTLVKEIKFAVAQLPPGRKKIFVMSREQGMTNAEICGALHLSMSTVKNTISSSLQSIRDHLKSKGYTVSIFYLLITMLKKY